METVREIRNHTEINAVEAEVVASSGGFGVPGAVESAGNFVERSLREERPTPDTIMNTTFQRMRRIYRVMRKVHGLGLAPLPLGLLFLFLRFLVWMFMTLDWVFFPALWGK